LGADRNRQKLGWENGERKKTERGGPEKKKIFSGSTMERRMPRKPVMGVFPNKEGGWGLQKERGLEKAEKRGRARRTAIPWGTKTALGGGFGYPKRRKKRKGTEKCDPELLNMLRKNEWWDGRGEAERASSAAIHKVFGGREKKSFRVNRRRTGSSVWDEGGKKEIGVRVVQSIGRPTASVEEKINGG